MIEGLETEEEEEVVMNAGILEVAKICNQNHFSGMINLIVNVSECVNVQVGQLEGFPSWQSAVASRGACLTSSTAWPGCRCNVYTPHWTPCRSAEKVAEEGEELVFSHNTA